MNKLETNVLILGKSGVGKSSFINYIYGKNIREIGAGKPVTKKGLYKVTHEVENIIVNIYDTWGLEANKTVDWKQIVLDEVKRHNEQISIKDWFHTIYYCFSASTARIEDFEIEEILKPLIMDRNKVTLIITHCDVPGAEEKSKGMIEKLLKALPINELDIIKVCSERKKLLGGKIKEPFGKEKVLEKLKSNLWNDIKIKIPRQYELYIINEIKEWKKEMENIIEFDYYVAKIKYDYEDICEFIDEAFKKIMLRLEKTTAQYLVETYMYYINLVKCLEILDDSIIQELSSKFIIDVNISGTMTYFWESILKSIDRRLTHPILATAKGLGRKGMKKELLKDLELQYNELLKKVPNLRNKLEGFMDTMDIWILWRGKKY